MINRAMRMIGTNQINKQCSKYQCYNQICAITEMYILPSRELLLLQRHIIEIEEIGLLYLKAMLHLLVASQRSITH